MLQKLYKRAQPAIACLPRVKTCRHGTVHMQVRAKHSHLRGARGYASVHRGGDCVCSLLYPAVVINAHLAVAGVAAHVRGGDDGLPAGLGDSLHYQLRLGLGKALP